MFSKQERREIYKKYEGHCAYCGKEISLKEMQIDHIIPKFNFYNDIHNNHWKIPKFLKHLTVNDLNHKDNLNPSCRKCNKFKDTFDLETFRVQIQLQVERLNKYVTQYQRAKLYGLVVETNKKIKFYFEDFIK